MKEEKQIGITAKKSEDFSEWYNQVVLKAELADFSAVKGFMIIRPRAYSIWEKYKDVFNRRIKALGHENAYFPVVIPESLFAHEKEHVKGFTPECFWVTEAAGQKLEEKLALRPTSEVLIGEAYSRWIRSWRDLPILWNLWNAVYRAETKMTKLFLRTREFLWQEGQTAHATNNEANQEVMTILNIYQEILKEYFAIPVLTGKKTEAERFAGALYTTTMEALMPDGKALQMGTSHNLGQNFAKAYNISFLDKDGQKRHVWTTSWGTSTRIIGALVMAHGDDKGFVCPPKLAEHKLVIIPILFEKTKQLTLKKAKELKEKLAKFSPILDDGEAYSAGWKFNEWELKGIPLRLEIGPKDIEKKQCVLVRRDNSEKVAVKESEVEKKVEQLLEEIQKNLYNKAKKFLEENTIEVKSWNDFKKAINEKKMAFSYFCQQRECEAKIKDETTASSRCIPFEQRCPEGKCVKCGSAAKEKAYFTKSY